MTPFLLISLIICSVVLTSTAFQFHPTRTSVKFPTPVGGGSKDDNANTSTCATTSAIDRRQLIISSFPVALSTFAFQVPQIANAAEEAVGADDVEPVMVMPSGDTKKLFNEGRALEMQGNIPAAQRIFSKVTKIAPRFIYGWASLGNTQVALGALDPAESSYSKAINLCVENQNKEEERFGVPRCNDLYLLYLNRGSLRLNNGRSKEALRDLEKADSLRAKPDAVVLQNRARARELNGFYAAADRDYTVAISMTSNEVAPFWLRSSLVKYELGEVQGAFDLIRRVENKFPEAPEVRAALATLLYAKGDLTTAQRKFLEIPDRQRLKYSDATYLKTTISWPPKMLEYLALLTDAVGDSNYAGKKEDVTISI